MTVRSSNFVDTANQRRTTFLSKPVRILPGRDSWLHVVLDRQLVHDDHGDHARRSIHGPDFQRGANDAGARRYPTRSGGLSVVHVCALHSHCGQRHAQFRCRPDLGGHHGHRLRDPGHHRDACSHLRGPRYPDCYECLSHELDQPRPPPSRPVGRRTKSGMTSRPRPQGATVARAVPRTSTRTKALAESVRLVSARCREFGWPT